MKCIHLEPGFLNSEPDQEKQWDRMTGKVINMLQDEPFLLISSTRSLEDLKGYLKNKHSQSITKDIYSGAARRFGQFIARILETCDIGILIVVGGDTLMALVSEMNIPFLHPVKEVLPGVVLSKVKIKGQSTYLVTKPGGYGEKDTLLRIIQHIKNQKI